MLLASLEHTERAAQRPTPTRRGSVSMRLGLQRVGGMAHSAALANESGLIQQASSSIWVHPAMDLRGGGSREMLTTAGSTAGCGKPHVRWCGRAAGCNSPQPHPIPGLRIAPLRERGENGRLDRERHSRRHLIKKQTTLALAALIERTRSPGLILFCFQVESNNPRPCGDTFHSSGV
jgi:hypothetical protein